MRRLPSGRWTVLCALAALAALFALPGPSGAQQRSMRFRPVLPESAAAWERSETRAERRAAARAGADTAGEVLVVPEPQEPPEPPQIRSTSGDMVRFGSDITIGPDQVVEGDVVAFGGDIEIRGRVTGNVSAMGGDLHLGSSASVEGDVVCIGGTLREEPGSHVGGQRVTAPRTPGAKFLFPMLAVVGTGVQIVVHAVGLLIMLGFAWAFVKLAPERTRGALETIRQEPGPSFLIGLLLWALIIPSVIALALVMAILCITIIGIPLAAAVAVGYVAFFVLAALWGSIVGYGVLGGRLYPRFRQGTATLMQAVVWGAIALHGMRIVADLFQIVPLFGVLGGLLKFMYFVIALGLGTLGAGALVRGEYRRRSLQTWWSRMRPAGAGSSDVPPPPPPASGSGAQVIG